MSTTVHRRQDRYGTKPPQPQSAAGKRLRTIGIVTGLGVLCIGAAFFAFRPSGSPVDPRTVSYDVLDSARTHVRATVVADVTRDIECALQATNAQEAVVGYDEVRVPADPGASTADPAVIDIELRTTQLASSGHVESCWFVD